METESNPHPCSRARTRAFWELGAVEEAQGPKFSRLWPRCLGPQEERSRQAWVCCLSAGPEAGGPRRSYEAECLGAGLGRGWVGRENRSFLGG